MSAPSVSPVLAYDDGGAGEPAIVFLHSLAGNGSHWGSQLPLARRARRAVAFDWRGHGRSPVGGDYSIPALARDVGEAIDRLGLQKVVLVGHSAGAAVALSYAARNPGRVAGLLLVDPAGDMRRVPEDVIRPFIAGLDSERYQETIEGYWKMILSGSSPEVEAKVMADLRSTSKEAVRGVFHALLAHDPVADLKAYPGPVLSVVTPSNNMPFSLHNLVPTLRRVTISGTGHWLQMDKPDEFNGVLQNFLASVTSKNF